MSNQQHSIEVNKMVAILQTKCPHCRKEKLFTHGIYHPTKFYKMHKKCPHCQVTLSPEPGFYYGAMYISYAFNVGILITSFVITLFLFPEAGKWVYIAAALVPTFLLFPLNFRLSRTLWLHFFGGLTYNPQAGVENIQHS